MGLLRTLASGFQLRNPQVDVCINYFALILLKVYINIENQIAYHTDEKLPRPGFGIEQRVKIFTIEILIVKHPFTNWEVIE